MRIPRRRFIQNSSIAGLSAVTAFSGLYMSQLLAEQKTEGKQMPYKMPDESAEHSRTWMAFIASDEIWTKKQIKAVQKNLALIATTIAKYEPVSMLVRPRDKAIATKLLGRQEKNAFPITLIECPLDDLWMRDTGPSFVRDSADQKTAVSFNFNGWGEKQDYYQDAEVAGFIAEHTDVPLIESSVIMEGGCFELDGEGTAIMSESCIINDNRNPDMSKADIEQELKRVLGLEKIIWLKGIKGKDITDGHTDFYARFAKPGVAVVSRDIDPDSYDYEITRENIEILTNATDAQGRELELVVLDTPWDITTTFDLNDFAAGYVGYYLCNGAVIMQKFGDEKADRAAKEKLRVAFPDRVVEQLSVDGIASGGGSIHCATQQEPI